MQLRRELCFTLLGLLAMASPRTALAIDYHWSFAGNGSWNTNTNSSPVGIPSLSTDRAFLDKISPGGNTVTLSGGTTTVGSVILGDSSILLLANARLSLTSGTSTVPASGFLTLHGGTIAGAGRWLFLARSWRRRAGTAFHAR